MRIIRPKKQKVSRYATLHRPHYICPECKVHIVRDREEDMFLCLQCGRKETRAEFRKTLISNVAAYQEAQRVDRKNDAARERVRRHLRTKEGKDAMSVVYYIQFQNLIKIGTTSDLRVRMAELPWDALLLTEPGSYEKERERHLQFNDARHQGEWFHPTPELLTFIEDRRRELFEHNARWYKDLPKFPWEHGDVDIPGWLQMSLNAHDVLEFNDAIQVDELEYSGEGFMRDQSDIVEM
ncbi:hypothetical protein phi16_gp098 [Corynebacterium phage phi16]|uniref:hypothetical protein n=1 Tax=Corynebacterium glutamicum TaxID=1718 RepID=UPI00097E19AD|nr:hypothetical protein [Corynebacterium glutamicum]APQ42601.1 hypothetical protein phi16_gp098 [Corynebacterium phage phi16]